MRPSAAVRSAGEAVGFGARPVRLTKWQPYVNESGSMRGFLDVELPSGLIVRGLRLMVSAKGNRFIAMPAIKTSDGGWSDIVDFRDRATRDKFAEPILALLRREHPEEFE